jgi:hypothetical protein
MVTDEAVYKIRIDEYIDSCRARVPDPPIMQDSPAYFEAERMMLLMMAVAVLGS